MAFRFTSPHLKEAHRLLTECPVGAILREAPYVYDAIRASAYAESGALNGLDVPEYLQRAIGVIGSERERLWRMKHETKAARGDSQYGMAVRNANR